MPYIEQIKRELYDLPLIDINEALTHQPLGHLNYVLTKITLNYMGKRAGYAMFAGVVGTLILMVFEIFRRRIKPYEDSKRADNGDVF